MDGNKYATTNKMILHPSSLTARRPLKIDCGKTIMSFLGGLFSIFKDEVFYFGNVY